jgi:hypothetical protein
MTNCSHCTREVEDEDVQQCVACGEDGLCNDCIDVDVHACEP